MALCPGILSTEAATCSLLLQVEALLEMGAALDCKDKQGRGPLHFAAANGRLPVVRHLWSRGAEVDAETPGGWGAWCALS